MSLLDGLARYLAAQGLAEYDPSGAAQTADWSAYPEQLPPQPDRVIGLWQYGGAESDSRNGWDEPSVQVRVRGTADPAVSRDRAQAIYDRLHGLGHTTLPGPAAMYVQLAIGVQGGPIYLLVDEVGRHHHVVNLRVSIDNPTIQRP